MFYNNHIRVRTFYRHHGNWTREFSQNHPRKLTESSAALHASRTKMLSVSVSHKVETSLFYREKEKVCFKDCVRMIQRCCFSFFLFSNAVLRPRCVHMAYFLVHSLAHSLYLVTSVLYSRAISGTRGSSGLGSHNSEHMESNTLDTVSAGDHWERRMSRQMAPLLLMLGW